MEGDRISRNQPYGFIHVATPLQELLTQLILRHAANL